jgi:hypothetical protein
LEHLTMLDYDTPKLAGEITPKQQDEIRRSVSANVARIPDPSCRARMALFLTQWMEQIVRMDND